MKLKGVPVCFLERPFSVSQRIPKAVSLRLAFGQGRLQGLRALFKTSSYPKPQTLNPKPRTVNRIPLIEGSFVEGSGELRTSSLIGMKAWWGSEVAGLKGHEPPSHPLVV